MDAAGSWRGSRAHSYVVAIAQTDLKNAGANWVDKEVVNDQGLVTSRKPDDIPAFNREMIQLFGEGHKEGRGPASSSSDPLRKTA